MSDNNLSKSNTNKSKIELEKVAFDIEAIEDCIDEIKNPDLKVFLENYNSNTHQILGSLAVPLILMGHGLKKVRYFQYWLEGAVKTKNVGKEKTTKGKKEIDDYINSKFDKEFDNHTDEAKKEIEKLRNDIPLLEKAIQNTALNTLVNTWTIFEATAKDLWIYSLNSHPENLLFNVLKSNTEDVTGITGKNISIRLLSKYDFNVSNNLGDILAPKFDFTTVKGIKKSYKSLFNFTNQELKVFDSKNLNQLEITRHLIVHSAGIIDQDYLKRSNRKKEKIGQSLKLSTKQLSDYCNSSIIAVVRLFKIIDKALI